MIRTVVALSLVAAVSACHHGPFGHTTGGRVDASTSVGYDATHFRAPARCVVHIFFEDDEIAIDHEPLRTRGCPASDVPWVVWRLPSPRPGAPTYTFAEDGIRFDKAGAPPGLKCVRSPQVVMCSFDREKAGSGKPYPYSIRVLKDGKLLKELDPIMIT